jgi:hypothetical protein
MTDTVKIETLHEVKSRQIMWLPWMEQCTHGLNDDSLVQTTTRMMPFGNYLISILPI